MTQPAEVRSRPPPLPVAVEVGMPIVVVSDGARGTIAGITESYSVHRLDISHALCVDPWSNIALANICPDGSQLPRLLSEKDTANARATTLREMIALQPFGLTDAQNAALEELIASLCGANAGM